MSDLASVDLRLWLLAVTPIALLVLLVVGGRWSTATKSVVSAGSAALLGTAAFGAGTAVLAVGVGKGIWTGIWILYVIWPALLLYRIAATAGLDRMGDVFASVLERDVENVLLVAWVFPSFVQGAAGFGTPIAVAAPLLLSMGMRPVTAVALPLVGYHWSVTFGSMGSSFYMGALTAGLDAGQQGAYAENAALILGVNMLVAGALVALLHGGPAALRQGARMLAVTGGAMFLALNLAVRVEPSIGTLAAGAAGLLTVLAMRAVNGREPAAGVAASPSVGTAAFVATRPAVVLLPYAYLLVLVLAVFLPPALRTFAKGNLLLGPSFPETATSLGMVNEAVSPFTPIALLGHPGTYILLSAVLGLVTYRRAGIWPRGELGGTLREWLRQAGRSSLSVLALATLATVMVDAGMVRTIAIGAAEVTGSLFPAVSPLIGALGSFTTGSTTTSNALFSALQNDVAHLIGVNPSELLAAQTSGGNVGNSLAPVVLLIGVTAIGAEDRMSEVFRKVVPPAGLLLAVVAALTFVLIALR